METQLGEADDDTEAGSNDGGEECATSTETEDNDTDGEHISKGTLAFCSSHHGPFKDTLPTGVMWRPHTAELYILPPFRDLDYVRRDTDGQFWVMLDRAIASGIETYRMRNLPLSTSMFTYATRPRSVNERCGVAPLGA